MGFVVNSVEANISDLTNLVTGLKERIKILTSLEDWDIIYIQNKKKRQVSVVYNI